MINRNSWYENGDFLYILLLDWPIKIKHPLITMSHHVKLAVYFKHIKPFLAHVAQYTLHDSIKAYLDQS